MSIKRLHEGFGIGQDSCVEGRHPMTDADIAAGTEGVYLGRNPESPSKGLFLTYWEADAVAQAIGFPHIAVYAEQKKLIDEQAQKIEDLEVALTEAVHTLQFEEVTKTIRKGNKEIIGALEATLGAVRARLGADGTDARPAAKPARASGSPVGKSTVV